MDVIKNVNFGAVVPCGHCAGQGLCKNGDDFYQDEDDGGIVNVYESCRQCLKKANESTGYVICSVCDGKGSIWIGPENVFIKEET